MAEPRQLPSAGALEAAEFRNAVTSAAAALAEFRAADSVFAADPDETPAQHYASWCLRFADDRNRLLTLLRTADGRSLKSHTDSTSRGARRTARLWRRTRHSRSRLAA